MISVYLLINVLIIAVPLLLTFEKKIKYYKKLPALFISIVIVGGTYIIWDIIATFRGDWDFNPRFISGLKIINLPIEEILFFITVPYSAIFLYETGKFYLKESTVRINRSIIILLVIALIIVAVIFINKYYTSTVLIFSALFLVISQFSGTKIKILDSRIYWIWILFMYFPFFIVNYFLTSLPVVTYSAKAILGTRVITIPIEDFFYSFSMLSFYLIVYLVFKERWLKENV